MEDEVSEGFKDCEQVHSSKESSKEWSMVVIRHSQSLPNDCSVFPPTNHENLHISPHTHQSTPPFSSASSSPSSSSSSSSSSPSSSSQFDQIEDDPEDPFSELDEIGDDPESFSPPDSRIRLPSDVSGWLGVGLEVLRSIVSGIRNYGTGRRPVWSAAGVVMAVLVSLLYRSVRRRRFREERVNQLIILLKERDERIIQLLQQIAKMNEVLLARHRVP